jgi:hypothetical protein
MLFFSDINKTLIFMKISPVRSLVARRGWTDMTKLIVGSEFYERTKERENMHVHTMFHHGSFFYHLCNKLHAKIKHAGLFEIVFKG